MLYKKKIEAWSLVQKHLVQLEAEHPSKGFESFIGGLFFLAEPSINTW